MYNLKDIEDLIMLSINDTRRYCLRNDCTSCFLAKRGACNRREMDFLSTRVCQYLANMGIIPLNKVSQLVEIFIHNDTNRFILEVYKVYQEKG